MDQGREKSKPQSASYRETFRRHRKLFCAPIVLGALAAALVLFGMGKTYKSTANLWVDTTPPMPSSISANASGGDGPPAAAEQALLSELLTTDAFDASVAKQTIGKPLSHAEALRTAQALFGTGQIVPMVTGNQILQISYTGSSSSTAQKVLAATIAQLRSYNDRLADQHNQAALAYDTEQVKAAEAAVTSARSSVTTYQAQHPGFSQTDPTYVSLSAAESNALSQLAQANTALSQVTGTTNADGWSIQVIDSPTPAVATPLKKRKVAEVILGGALGGLLVSFLAVVALTPAKKEAWEDELPTGAPFVPSVPPVDPFRAGATGVPMASAHSAQPATGARHSRLSLGDRRFQVGARSEPTQER